jgi:hypothetical protein
VAVTLWGENQSPPPFISGMKIKECKARVAVFTRFTDDFCSSFVSKEVFSPFA